MKLPCYVLEELERISDALNCTKEQFILRLLKETNLIDIRDSDLGLYNYKFRQLRQSAEHL